MTISFRMPIPRHDVIPPVGTRFWASWGAGEVLTVCGHTGRSLRPLVVRREENGSEACTEQECVEEVWEECWWSDFVLVNYYPDDPNGQ